MKRTLPKFLFLIVVFVAISLACNFSASTANITDAYMARDDAGNEPTTTFAQDEVFNCFVTLKNAPDDTELTAVWKVVNVEGEQPGYIIDDATLITGSGKHQFYLTNEDLWPAGTYAVEIYMNGELQKTLEFLVE